MCLQFFNERIVSDIVLVVVQYVLANLSVEYRRIEQNIGQCGISFFMQQIVVIGIKDNAIAVSRLECSYCDVWSHFVLMTNVYNNNKTATYIFPYVERLRMHFVSVCSVLSYTS